MDLRLAGTLLGLLATVLAACERAEPFQARFAVRGRWPGERALVHRIESADGPLAPAEFRGAIEAALTQWQATGCVTFRAARDGEEPALLFAWRRGVHRECVPFGADPGVAHAGPPGPGTFVHFDADRTWDAAALERAALHEVGHVLGLDHSPDEEAVMYAVPSPARAQLGRSDLAGIHSLYGGGASASGDLVVTGVSAELVLHAVAPPALTDWTLFDTDGDGDEEIVVWRTDADGSGALWTYHFARGALLERTLGPLYGVAAPGCELELVRPATGERLLVLTSPGGTTQLRAFDGEGLPGIWTGDPAVVPGASGAAHAAHEGDLDGDGRTETVRRRE